MLAAVQFRRRIGFCEAKCQQRRFRRMDRPRGVGVNKVLVSRSSTADRDELKRLLALVCAVVFLDTMFYAVVAPLLPALAQELKLSRLRAGVLTGSYAGGILLGSIPAGVFASRSGPRASVILGLTILGGSSVGFGQTNVLVLLDLARILQGVGGAFTWAGALTWLVAEAPAGRRGELIGITLAAATAGGFFGPALGTVAHILGRGPVFAGVAVVAAGLAVAARQTGSSHVLRDAVPLNLSRALTRPSVAIGMWLVLVAAIAQALITLLAPLRISNFGGSAEAIGAAFLLAAALEAAVSLLAGRLSDRHGQMPLLLLGLAIAAILIPSLAVPTTALALAALVVLAGGAIGLFWTPAIALLSAAADKANFSQGIAFGLMNLAWAAGQIAGATGGGALAKSAGDACALAAAGILCAATGILVGVRAISSAGALTFRPKE